MLSLIQKLFGTSKARAKAPESKTQQHFEPASTMPVVEVAHLRLNAILERFPEELKALVLKMPDATVTVALPISTIVKQLPGGSVKLSLATLHRQAPVGLLGPLPPGDKRMVEVPLSEVFRHIKPTAFKRRNDQKPAEALDSQFNLFGDAENPYQIAPTAPEDEVPPAPAPPEPPRILKLDPAVREPVAASAPSTTTAFRLARDPAPLSAPRVVVPPPDKFEPRLEVFPTPEPAPAVPAAVPEENQPSIMMPLEALCTGWPEPIRHELAALNGAARVSLPKADVTAGLARGRVMFTWGQIRGWMVPSPGPSTNADEATELILPLKLVAPVFLHANKAPKSEQKSASFATDIPALFNAAREVAAPASEAHAVEAPAISELPAAEEPATELPETSEEPVTTVGQLFGQPEKSDWTPAELVSNLAQLGGVSGAVVALQEGLLVAHSLPADVKSDVIAAFLPQLFARLNQYSAEMKLGEVDDLLFTTHGAHCQIYRLGYIYFAVLGKPGETLPWTELRLVADELARQTQKS